MTPFRVATLSTIDQQCTCMPYLELEISKAVNLPVPCTGMALVAQISQNFVDWQTQPVACSEEGFEWNEVFALELDMTEEFSITLFDRNKDDCLVSKHIFPANFASVFLDEDLHCVCLRLPQGPVRTQVVEQEVFCSPAEQIPMLMIKAKVTDPESPLNYTVEVERIWHNIDAKPIYTVYETVVTRPDGTHWQVPLRYSKVCTIRKELIKACPALRQVPFPGKTYCDWLCCESKSRFSQKVIEARREGIERFLNAALELHSNLHCESLLALLRILRL